MKSSTPTAPSRCCDAARHPLRRRLVRTKATGRCDSGAGERGWTHEAQKRIGGFLGDIRLAAPRSSYPLGFHHAARITDTRLALVGDAAHASIRLRAKASISVPRLAALAQVIRRRMRLASIPAMRNC